VKAFGVVSRFVHLEFFRLDSERPGLGDIGDFVALEVNMRPAGGYTPDMINYAHSADVYKVWADMVAFDELRTEEGKPYYCAFASRRDIYRYRHSHNEVRNRYSGQLMMCERMPELFSAAMGQQMKNEGAMMLNQAKTRTMQERHKKPEYVSAYVRGRWDG
jgi:hypothetical protein